jgi:hypothetical protein
MQIYMPEYVPEQYERIPYRFARLMLQHRRLFGLPCLQICLCLDHRELLAFLHREAHSRCSVLVQRTSSILSSFTSLFS